MNCDDAKLELALWIGSDLDDPIRIEELRRHVATCPQCRVQARSLQTSLGVLAAINPDATFDHGESLWPELNARIDFLENAPKSPSAYGKWAILLACCVGLCLGIWALTNRSAPSESPPPVSQPVPDSAVPTSSNSSSSIGSSSTRP